MNNRTRCSMVIGVAILWTSFVAVMSIGQERALLFWAKFDGSADADVARGSAIAMAQGLQFRLIAQEGGKGVVMGAGSILRYRTEGNFQPQRGTIEFGIQPLVDYRDGRNHRFFSLGDRDAPNSIIIWKTAIANDLRFRIVHADGKYSEIAVPRTLSVGDWHYITFTWDIERGTMTAYLNGALVGRRRLREAPFDPSAISFCIGAGPTGAESAQAVFDDFKIYARVKQQREVSNSYERFLMTERFTFTDETNAPPLNMSTALLSPPQLLFAVISDTHISAPNVHGRFAHNERVRWLIKQLNAFKPALIVNCGDINTYFPRFPGFEEGMKEAQRLMKQLAVPVYQAPGNHDVGNKHQLTFRATPNRPAEGWFVNEENIAVYRKFFGPDYFSFDKGGCHFIVLNNQVFNSGLPTEREQWQWLLSDLADHRNARFIFMFMHNPLFWVSPDDIGTNNYEVVNEPRRSELMELIRKYRVTAVFTGHTHHRISNLLDNTRYLTLPSTTFARPFGRNYERSMLATIYDPLKVGYYIVRVYDNAVHINLVRHYAPLPKRINIQADNAQPRIRLLNRVATEVDDNLLGITSALPPPIEYGQWASEHLIDGVTGEMVTGDRISQFGWTSQPYAPNEQHEWVELELARLVSVAKIELYPRPGGGGFPISFTVALSADGKRYERIARFDDFPQPTSAKPVVIEVPAERRKPVKYVRVDITRMPPMYLGHRASFMEIAVRDEHGRNYAIATAGAKVRTKSQASSTRRTVDDTFWTEPLLTGIKWVRVPPEALMQDNAVHGAHVTMAVHVRRAFSLGLPIGVNMLLPLSMDALASVADGELKLVQAFKRYCASMAQQLNERAAGWVLYPPRKYKLSDNALQRCIAIARECIGSKPLFVYGFQWSRNGELSTPVPLSAVAGRAIAIVCVQPTDLPERTLRPLIKQLRKLRMQYRRFDAWVELQPWRLTPDAGMVQAAYLARSVAMLFAEGIHMLWDAAPGQRGSILDSVGNPTTVHYAMRTLATLLDASAKFGKPSWVQVETRSSDVQVLGWTTPDERKGVILWRARAGSILNVPAIANVNLKGISASAQVIGVDIIAGTVQSLETQREGELLRIQRLQITAAPIAIVIQ